MTGSSRLNPSEIVGGQPAPKPIPWQVSVQKLGIHHCGATILDKFTLLSAAHCFDNDNNFTDGKSIRAGSTQMSSGGQVCIIFKFGIWSFNSGFKIRQVLSLKERCKKEMFAFVEFSLCQALEFSKV